LATAPSLLYCTSFKLIEHVVDVSDFTVGGIEVGLYDRSLKSAASDHDQYVTPAA
jgi:hypothetical protein